MTNDETRERKPYGYSRYGKPTSKSRPGLYLITGTTMFATLATLCCGPCTPVASTIGSFSGTYFPAEKKLELHVEDVLSDDEPEMFYMIDGQRAYLEIDGVPVEECF